MGKKDILFLLPYPLHRAPSQRFRVENLLFLLDEAEKSYDLAPFMSNELWDILYKNGSLPAKALGIIKSYFKRLGTVLFKAKNYEYIFIHREAAPLGPPIFEWILSKVLRKKIIYDFDDAIWIPNTSAQNKIAGLVKAFWKVKHICKWSYKVSAGNDFLCAFAEKSGAKSVTKIPTVVNTETRYNFLKQHKENNLVVGWTGSHSTLKFLDEVIPVLKDVQHEIPFTFLVIADKEPKIDMENLVFFPWNEKTEIAGLEKIDIGIMPLTNDAWSEGKCGFKLIQYLSLGIPAIANSVGVNKQIIIDGQNGYIADNNDQWKTALRFLLKDKDLRARMGDNGRKNIVESYSILAIREDFISLFSERQ